MSARPRPVTATFPPPPLISPVHLRPTSRSPSPLNSTASLLSILDHNSYESAHNRTLRDENDGNESYRVYLDKNANNKANVVEGSSTWKTGWDEDARVAGTASKGTADNRGRVVMARTKHSELKRSQSVEASKQTVENIPSAVSSKNASYEAKSFEAGSSFEKDMKDSSNHLSAWERWIVQKAKEDRARAEQELDRQKKLCEEEERIQKEKERKKKNVEKVIQEWVKKYDLKKKQDIETELQKSHEQEERKKKQKQTVSEKAKVKYVEWVEKKAEEDAKKKKELAEKKEKEQREKANRQKMSEEAFHEWRKKAQSRPRTAPSSYGYSDGRLTGYYDTGAYPVPSYVNPVPWRPVEIPRPKSQTKKKKTNSTRRYCLSSYA